MSVVSLLGVKILNNPAAFTDSYQFEITFECLEQLQKGKRNAIPSFKANILTRHVQTLNGSSPMSVPPLRKSTLLIVNQFRPT
jgi:hypothetical protein